MSTKLVAEFRIKREVRADKWIMENKSSNVWKIINEMTKTKEEEKQLKICVKICKGAFELEDERKKKEVTNFWRELFENEGEDP